MKKTIRLLAAALTAFSLAACAGQEDSKQSSAASAVLDQNSSAVQASSASQASSESQASSADEQQPAESTDTPQPGVTAQDLSSSAAGKLEQAYSSLGYAVSPIEFNTGETGNSIADFSVDCAGSDIAAFVTSAANGNTAQMTYDANIRGDETNQMTIMNQWSDANGNQVSVVRNNMANLNFVEVLDPSQQIAIHIVNNVPEQLDVSLQAVAAIGYPTGQ